MLHVLKSHPAHEQFLLLHIASKLKTKKTENYRARIANYTSAEKILRDLTLHYVNVGITDQVFAELRAIKQGAHESVGDYGLCVEKLFNRFMTITESAPVYLIQTCGL